MGILQNWMDAMARGSPLFAPGEEGIKGLEISNAIYLSAWLNKPVTVPVDPELFYDKLQEKIATSNYNKSVVSAGVRDSHE